MPACVPGAEAKKTEKDIIVQNALNSKKFIQEKIERFGEKWGYARNAGKISCLEMKRCARNVEHIRRNIERLTQYQTNKSNALKKDSENSRRLYTKNEKIPAFVPDAAREKQCQGKQNAGSVWKRTQSRSV